MAKGNDGNLLQHSVECAVARHLLRQERGLHLVSTHAMAPFEEFLGSRLGGSFKRLDGAIGTAQQGETRDEPPVIGAYRKTHASPLHYPNSAELIGTLVPSARFSGVLVDADEQKVELLRSRWLGSDVQVHEGSWRAPSTLARLAAPGRLDRPWLFSMDPMTFVGVGRDDDQLHEGDVDRLLAPISSYLNSGQPGAALIFCYSLRRNLEPFNAQAFESSMSRLSQGLGAGFLDFVECEVANPHICAVIATETDLIDTAKRAWQQFS